MNIQQISPKAYNFNTNQSRVSTKQNISFEGKPQILLNFEESIAKGLGKLASTKAVEKLIIGTSKHDSLVNKNTGALFAHLTVFGSTLLSIFYVTKTLTNKDLEEKKRKTLAINQGLVWLSSTILAYTLDLSVKGKFNKMVEKFRKANSNLPEKEVNHLVGGMKVAKGIIAVDTVYRFIAPVLVTPLANHYGNKINEKKKAKSALANNQKMNQVG